MVAVLNLSIQAIVDCAKVVCHGFVESEDRIYDCTEFQRLDTRPLLAPQLNVDRPCTGTSGAICTNFHFRASYGVFGLPSRSLLQYRLE